MLEQRYINVTIIIIKTYLLHHALLSSSSFFVSWLVQLGYDFPESIKHLLPFFGRCHLCLMTLIVALVLQNKTIFLI